MLDQINNIIAEIKSFLANSETDIEEFRIKYLSKKGKISVLFNDFRSVPADQKRIIGEKLNEVKKLAQEKLSEISLKFETKSSKDFGNRFYTSRESRCQLAQDILYQL